MKFRVSESIDYASIPDENKNGDCFVVASNYVQKHPEAILCHGIVTGQGPIAGVQYNHAWVEEGDTVIDKTVDITLPKIVYYAIGNIEIVKRYTFKEMLEQMIEHETYGPWDKELPKYM